MATFNYSFELSEFDDALTAYGTITTRSPTKGSFVINDFTEGTHFRTAPDPNNQSLCLQLENRLLTLVLDESGSMTWNDNAGDRYTYFTRLLTKLEATYPGTITTNIIGFGGVPTRTTLFVAIAGNDFLTATNQNFNQFLQQIFQDSVYDFAGVRVVRRTDRFPTHPADGVIVAEGIIDAAKDEDLTQGQQYFYGIWTFNKNLLFSVGQFVSGTPFDRILPRGVNNATSLPRILPGVERDTNTELIYNFVEGTGFLVFDSSGNAKHGTVGSETIEENFWSGDASAGSFAQGSPKKAIGVRFDGLFDIIETTADASIQLGAVASTSALTINVWLFRYARGNREFVIGTSAETPSDDTNWSIVLETNGDVGIIFTDLTAAPSTFSGFNVPLEKWTMVTISISSDRMRGYIDGVEQFDTAFSTSLVTQTRLFTGAIPQDSSVANTLLDYFGSLSQISIHSVGRSATYISGLFDQELLLFDQPLSSVTQNPVDNRQREVLLSWDISDDFNFSNGTVKILRKYRAVPSHENDGDVVVSQAASAGQFFFLDTFDFINNSDYFYRIFTINSLGNISDRSEARILSAHIPRSTNPVASPVLSPVSSEVITAGNRKTLLQWSNPTDNRWRGTKIFFSLDDFPTFSLSPTGDLVVSDGVEIKDTTGTTFAHRTIGLSDAGTANPLVNGRDHFYTLITYDRLGRFSESRLLRAVPSIELENIFIPEEVRDLHIELINPRTLSIQWDNPTVKSDRLDLFFGESALVFVSVKDIFGGNLEDVNDLELQVCTTIFERRLKTTERKLGTGSDDDNPAIGCRVGAISIEGECRQGSRFDDNCNTEQEEAETIINFATIESGLIKGLLTHSTDRNILTRRKAYIMDVRARYKVIDKDSNSGESLFEFNTECVTIEFRHPIKLSAINKFNKKSAIGCEVDGGIRGSPACGCPDETGPNSCPVNVVNGGFINAVQPYVCRIEVQFKGEALPDGTPVRVELFKHGSPADPNPLSTKSTRTFIDEGFRNTSAILEPELDKDGNPTGALISKSVVDIEIQHPPLPDFVDIYIVVDHLGFFVDGVHEVRFIASLFLTIDISAPAGDGIDVAEQFATVYTVNPDFPGDPTKNLPAPDGTLVKWELIKLLFGKERPFYSTEPLNQLLSGVYSSTTSGVARNIFFGPVGNIDNHNIVVECNEEVGSSAKPCCIGEEYAIRASVILGEETSTDSVRFSYPCDVAEFSAKRFLMNADFNQPQAGGSGFQSPPHWVVWADGIHMLKFQIAQNAALSQILGADCFRTCVDVVSPGQNFPLATNHIVQINAPGEILWNVVFDEDPYTGELTPVTFDSISEKTAENLNIPFVANIPITGVTTDFFVRDNAFIGNDGSLIPQPEDCDNNSLSGSVNSCLWVNICDALSNCGGPGSITTGPRWDNVSAVSGTTTLIANNKEVTLAGGGSYGEGIPPIYIGFREPLDVRIIDARINGQPVTELIPDSFSIHTFTVEVTFSGKPVPDGTIVEVQVTGEDQNIVILSNCTPSANCQPGAGGVVHTRLTDDPITGRNSSYAFFSIDPLPRDVGFNAKINVTCRFDKLGTVEREITTCIEVANSVEPTPVLPPDPNDPQDAGSTSGEAIIYDTVQDSFSTTRASQISRMGHFVAASVTGTSDFVYIFGGYTGASASSTASITPLAEAFNNTTQKWAFVTSLPTPRAYGMTVISSGKIYCIGGVELDQLSSQFVISRKVEVYDILTDTWMELALMPVDSSFNPDKSYGVAYGDAQVVGDNIYVTCGLTNVINSSQPGELNDRILRYSISSDVWTFISPSDVPLYQRLAPFGFYRSSPQVGSAEDVDSAKMYYIYGGSIPKPREVIEAERQEKINQLIAEFRASILGSSYFASLTPAEQEDFIAEREQEIANGVVIPAFIYPSTGFRFLPGSETINVNSVLEMDISDTLDRLWPTLPKTRDHGRAVYIPFQDIAYFMGGSNQNQSTTLNRIESIDLANNNQYDRKTPFNRGRAMFGAVSIADDIFLSGGLTSGHKTGFVQIDVKQIPDLVEARGSQSSGILITLKNDSGEILDENIRVNIRGRLRLEALDEILSSFFANRAADRALGGDGSGNAPDLPQEGDNKDINKIIRAQNRIIDPNSDEFQFNAARKLGEQVFLFPILYSSTDFTINSGVGSTTLLPRSEDPLSDFVKLAEFIQSVLQNTPDDPDERFTGDLTRDELAALGESLDVVKLPPTILDSGALRNLYDIETIITILETDSFGQTVSEFDLDVQDKINSRIEELLTPPEPSEPPSVIPSPVGGGGFAESECFVLQHSAQPSVPPSNTPPQNNPNNPSGIGGFSQSGQCLFCQTVLPLNVDVKLQLPAILTTFYNVVDWMPQIKKRLVTNDSTVAEAIAELDVIDKEVPFGGSQLFNALFEAGRIMGGDEFDSVKKSIYIASDNSQNLSLVSRTDAIEEINAIDGDKKVPVVYVVFSTSFPTSLAAQLQRTEISDIEKISEATGGQSTTLISNSFMDQILNLALGTATGGLGYGIYVRLIDLGDLSALTAMTLDFNLPSNTQGFVRFKHSRDGFNFTDFSQRFEGSQFVDFIDFFAKKIEIEVVLTTGFTTSIAPEYDTTATGLPKLLSIIFDTSNEREDFMFLNTDDVLTNAQQVAAAFDGTIPENGIIEIGVATSNSHDWRDFQSIARPVLQEIGKTFLLERTDDPLSLVPIEQLTTINGILYTTNYKSWDPDAAVSLFEVDSDGLEVPVLSGFVSHPRQGQIYFDTRQPPSKIFKLAIVNSGSLRIGVRLRNRLHTESIVIRGVGFIYSTNDDKPIVLTQVAPKAVNVTISPSSPTASDTIFALYDFIDLNGDPESDTIIAWFKDSVQLLEIQGKSSWSNNDLLLSNKLEPGDSITVHVTPGDGRDFGTKVISAAVTIQPQEPGIVSAVIVPIRSGVINNVHDTSSVFQVDYIFLTDDTGPGSVENGTVIKWFVNGNLFKEGTFSATVTPDPYDDPKIVSPGDAVGGTIAHVIGNQVFVEITPKTLTITGDIVQTATVTVENSVPRVSSIVIQPSAPTPQSTLLLTFIINDLDIDNGIQTDQSEIKWFKNSGGSGGPIPGLPSFIEVPSLAEETSVPSNLLVAGEQWMAQITPFDGLDLGVTTNSNIVTIQ